MAASVLEIGLSNLTVSAAIAVFALIAGWWGRRPALTHALWLLVLLKLVTPPVIDWPVPLLPAEPAAVHEVSPPVPVDSEPEPVHVQAAQPAPVAEMPMQPIRRAKTIGEQLQPPIASEAAVSAEPSMPSSTPLIPLAPASAAPIADQNSIPMAPPMEAQALTEEPASSGAMALVVVWLAGSVAWSALVCRRVRRFTRLLRLASPAPLWLKNEMQVMARELGLAKAPAAKLIPGAVAPMLWSLGRPAVFLPGELIARLSAGQRASLIAHELAHLKRRDHRVRWLELAVMALYWWCPLAWLARRELRRAEEESCDAWVVSVLPSEGRTYATALLDTLDFLAESPRAPALASGMGSAAAVKRRLTLILDGRTPRRLPLLGRMLVVLSALLLLPIAPKLARLAASSAEEAGLDDAKAAAKNETAPAPKTAKPIVAYTNPRGEPLLFETSSTEVRPGADNWWTCSVSPNGQWIAVGSGRGNTKGEILIWERETGTIKKKITAPKGVRSVAFSPDGKVLATGTYDSAVRFYNTVDYALIGESEAGSQDGHKNGVNSVAFFKDGKYAASAGLDNTCRIWDVSAIWAKSKEGQTVVAKPVAVFEGHTQGVLSVSVSTDGLTLLSGSFDRTARCYDVPDPLPKMGEPPVVVKKERVVLQGHNSAVEAVAVSPDGQTLVTGSWDAQLMIRDRDGKVENTIRSQTGVMCVAFSKDGKHVAAGCGNQGNPSQQGEIRVWDIENKKEAAYRADYPAAVLGLAFTPDGKTVVSTGADRALHLWPFAEKDRKSHRQPGLFFEPQQYMAGTVSPSGEWLAVSGDGKSIYILNRKDNSYVAELTGHEDVIAGLAFSPDGKTLASASYDRTIKLWTTATWKERKTLTGHTGWVLGVAFAPDSKTLASGSYDKSVRLWDAETGDVKGTWKDHSAGVRSVAFSPDGKRLISGGSDRILRIWNVADGSVLQALKGHKSAVRSVAFAADNKTVASGAEDKTVKVWDADTGKETQSFTGLPEMVTTIHFSPKGQSLLAGTFQGQIVILDPLTGRIRQTVRSHSDAVTGLVFTDNGQSFVSISHDRSIRVWPAVKPSNVAPVQTLAAKVGVVAAMGIAPNGVAAVIGNADGMIFLWEIKTGDLKLSLVKHTGGIVQIAASNTHFAAINKDGALVVGGLDSQMKWSAKGRFAVFTPDGKRLAVAEGKDIVIYEVDSGKEWKRLAGNADDVQKIAISVDGQRLASAGEETKVRLWNIETGEKLQETPAFGNYSSVTHLSFAPDGTRFAAAAYGPEQAPPDDMTGNFRVTREVRVFTIPANDKKADLAAPVVFSPQPNDQPITGMEWVANGQAIVMPASDGTVRVNELAGNGPREVQRFRAHDSAVLASAVSLEGGVLITAGEDLAVRRWRLPGFDPAPGQARLTAQGLTRVWQMIPSPDGKYFVTGGEGDKTFRVYSAVPGGVAAEPDRHGSAYSLCFSPENKFLLTGHDKGQVVVRDAATGKAIRVLPGFTKRVFSIVFAEKGAAVVAVGGNIMNGEEPGEAIVWDFAKGTVRHKLDAPVLQWMVAAHPNGQTVAGAGNDGSTRIWDVATGKLVKELTKGRPGLYSVAFDATGGRLATGSSNRLVRIWDVAGEKVLHEIATNKELRPSQAIFSPDGKEIVVSSWRGVGPDKKPEIAAYTIANRDAAPRIFPSHPASVMNIAFLPEGKTLVAAGGEDKGQGSVRAYDFATAKPIAMFSGHRNWGQSLAVSGDGKIASTSWGTPANGEIRIWDPRGIQPIAEVKVPGENQYISSGAISKDGKLLVLGGWGQTVTMWDMSNPAKPVLRKQSKDHTAGLRSVSFDSAGGRFVTADESGAVKVWDAGTLNLIVSFRAGPTGVYRAKFTPDGTGIVTVGGNWQAKATSQIRIWDPISGKETGHFPEQEREVWDFVFLADGKQMAVIHTLTGQPTDANVKIWDFERKEVVQSLLPPGTFTNGRCLSLSPDGGHLAVGSSSGPVKVFNTQTWQEELDIPAITNCTFALNFTKDSNTVLIASGEGAAISVQLPMR